MKNLMYLSIFLMLCIGVFAQEADRYTQAMKQGVNLMNDAEGYATMEQAALLFERIAMTETGEWLPPYYASACYTIMSLMEREDKEKKSAAVDKAQALLDKAKTMNEHDSEIYALQGMIYQALIQLNPMINGMLYGSKATKQLDRALELNPNNPRPYYLKAMGLYYTPALFGGGEGKACVLFEKAAEKFKGVQLSYSIEPAWGEKRNAIFLNKCRNEEDSMMSN